MLANRILLKFRYNFNIKFPFICLPKLVSISSGRHAENEFFKNARNNRRVGGSGCVGSIQSVRKDSLPQRFTTNYGIYPDRTSPSGESGGVSLSVDMHLGPDADVRHQNYRTSTRTQTHWRCNWTGKLHISGYFYTALNGGRESNEWSCLWSAMK